MRGKLRDKPTNAKQYRLRRELMERRPAKRQNRATNLLNQHWEDDDNLIDENKELLVATQNQKK